MKKYLITLLTLSLLLLSSCGLPEEKITMYGTWEGVSLNFEIPESTLNVVSLKSVQKKLSELYGENTEIINEFYFTFNDDGTGSLNFLTLEETFNYGIKYPDILTIMTASGKELPVPKYTFAQQYSYLRLKITGIIVDFIKEEFPDITGTVQSAYCNIVIKKAVARE